MENKPECAKWQFAPRRLGLRHAHVARRPGSARGPLPHSARTDPPRRARTVPRGYKEARPPFGAVRRAATMRAGPVVVAYTSNPKKQRQFFEGLAATCDRSVVRLVPLGAAGVPDAVLHKRTDDMAAAVAAGDRAALKRVRDLEGVLALPGVVGVDSLRGVWSLIDRVRIGEVLDAALGSGVRGVRVLPWRLVPYGGSIADSVRGMQFPLILKRRLACGTRASHEMVIADDMAGLLAAASAVFGGERCDVALDAGSGVVGSDGAKRAHGCGGRVEEEGDHSGFVAPNDQFTTDIVAQEFVPEHGEVLFKVYAIGERIIVQARSSVSCKRPTGKRGYFYFDSQHLGSAESFVFDSDTGCSHTTEAIMPSRALMAEIVALISAELDLTLIGVDLVYDIRAKNYAVVDVNYFPGYKGVAKAHQWLLDHICDLVHKQRRREHEMQLRHSRDACFVNDAVH